MVGNGVSIGSGSPSGFSGRVQVGFVPVKFKKGIGSGFRPYIMKQKMNTPENIFDKI